MEKHSVLDVAIVEYHGAILIIIIFAIKTQNHVPVVTLLAKDNQKYQHFLAMGLKDQCIGMNIKQKVKTKNFNKRIQTFS